MSDFLEMRKVFNHAINHDNGCSCALQQQVTNIRSGLNTEEWTPMLTTLFARIDQLEAALDEVGNALVSIVGNNNAEWGQTHKDEGTDVLLDLACETYENVRHQ